MIDDKGSYLLELRSEVKFPVLTRKPHWKGHQALSMHLRYWQTQNNKANSFSMLQQDFCISILQEWNICIKGKDQNILLGTTDVQWKPILTTIPEILFAAYKAKVACMFNNKENELVRWHVTRRGQDFSGQVSWAPHPNKTPHTPTKPTNKQKKKLKKKGKRGEKEIWNLINVKATKSWYYVLGEPKETSSVINNKWILAQVQQ